MFIPGHPYLQLTPFRRLATKTSTVLLIIFILFLRAKDRLLNAQLWAEDGVVFFQDAYNLNFWTSIFKTYRGYYHLLPRFFSEVAMIFRLELVPTVFALTSFAIAITCCSFFLIDQFTWIIPNIFQRSLFCIILALIPANDEILVRFVNMQWYIGIFCMLLVIMELPKSRLGQGLYISIWFICAATSPQSIIFIPCLLVRLIVDRRNSKPLFIALAVVTLVFVLVVKQGLGQTPEAQMERPYLLVPLAIVNMVNTRVLATAFIGLAGIRTLIERNNADFFYLPFLLFIIFIFFVTKKLVAKGPKNTSSLLWVYLLYCIFAPIVLTLLGRPDNIIVAQNPNNLFGGERYYVLSIATLYLSIFWCAQIYFQSIRQRVMSNVVIVFALLLPVTADFFPINTPDKFWALYVQQIKLAEAEGNRATVRIPTNPTDDWAITVRAKTIRKSLPEQLTFVQQPAQGGLDQILVAGKKNNIAKADSLITVSGWALDRDVLRPAPSIIVLDENSGTVLGQVQPIISRPDVASFLKNDNLLVCGWELQFPAILLPQGNHTIVSYVYNEQTKQAFPIPGKATIDISID